MNIKTMKEVYEYLRKHHLSLNICFDDKVGQYRIYLEGCITKQVWRIILYCYSDEVDQLCNSQLSICQRLIHEHKKANKDVKLGDFVDEALGIPYEPTKTLEPWICNI